MKHLIPLRSCHPALAAALICCAAAMIPSAHAMLREPFASQSAAAQNVDLKPIFNDGEASLQRGDLGRAESDFRKIVEADPRMAGAWANLGVIAMRRKQWTRALELLTKAGKLAPDVAGVRLNIGLVYFHEEEFRSAIAPFASVVRDAPDSRQARYLLGLCYFFSNRNADATDTLEPLWDAESTNVSYLYVLGIAAGNAKLHDVESKALGRLVEVGGDTPEFHLFMAKADLNRQEPERALAELQQAEKADPTLPFLHFNFGVAYMAMNQYDDAREEFLKDIAIEPDVAWNYDELGSLYSRRHDETNAEKYFREALARDPHLASSQFGLGEIYLREGKFPEALAALDSAEKLAPDSRNVRYVRARVLAHMGRDAEAKREFAEAERLMSAELAREDQIRSGMETGAAPIPNPELMKAPQ